MAHEAHEDVGQIPRQIEAVHAAVEDGGQTQHAEDEHAPLGILEDVAEVRLGIEVVADEAGEREGEDRRR